MAPMQVADVQGRTWSAFQARIDRLSRERMRLVDEWRLAMKRACCAPAPYRDDALQTVGDTYRDVVEAIDAHIKTLRACTEAVPLDGCTLCY